MKEILKLVGKGIFILFLLEAGWLLHLIEGASQAVVKSKKGWNKKAIGAGSIAALVADPIQRLARMGRIKIKDFLKPYSLTLSSLV
jgi:hypothetical protein